MAQDHVKQKLDEVIGQARVRIDLDSAQNPELRRAIHIVEVFLQKSGRVCYGGQAINAHLPAEQQFYDSERSLPDYDFFSPEADSDTNTLITLFKEAGFTEISKRIGIHDGTIKIYVNYTAIADISQMIPEFYNSVFRKSNIINGIRYADPIFLRMLMYLELSRPRGQVARWGKVYDRLMLLDRASPIPSCKSKYPQIIKTEEAEKARPSVVRYMIKNNRIFAGGDIYSIYKLSGHGKSTKSRTQFLLHGSAPIVFFSPDATEDSIKISEVTNSVKREIVGYQNMLPAMIALMKDESLIALIIQEEACHSYVKVPLTKGRYLRMASLDSLLTLLIGMYYRDDSFLMAQESLICWIRNYIDLSDHYKLKPTKLFPAFPIDCSGYQTSFASLLRAKVARIQADRQKLSSGRELHTRTIKQYVNHGSRRTRRKNY